MNDKTLAAGSFLRPAQFSPFAQAVDDGGKVEREPVGERGRPFFQLFPVEGTAGIGLRRNAERCSHAGPSQSRPARVAAGFTVLV